MRLSAQLVEEAIAVFQPSELISHNARSYGSHNATLDGPFSQNTNEEINVINALVEVANLFHHLRTHHFEQVIKVLSPGATTRLQIEIVAGQSVIPSTPQVSRHQIQAPRLVR